MAGNDVFLSRMIPIFDPDDPANTAAVKWEKWLARLETYFIAKDITKDEKKKAQLLLLAGPKVYDI